MTIRNTVGAAGLVLAAADGGELPMPRDVVCHGDGMLGLLFDRPDDVQAWADWVGAEAVSHQVGEDSREGSLIFRGEIFDQPVCGSGPLFAAVPA